MMLILLILLPVAQSAHIFAGAFLGGSHLSSIYNLAVILAEAGHNITFINMESGQLEKCTPHPNIHPIDMPVWDGPELDLFWSECTPNLILSDSSDVLRFASESCTAVWREIWKRSAGVYTSGEVLDLFNRTHFDVILGGRAEYSGLTLLGTLTNVPVINFEPTSNIQHSLSHNNLPTLVTSQPSLVFTRGFHHSPSIMERLSGLKNAIRFFPFTQAGPQALQPVLERFGFSSPEDVKDSIKLFLTNDHPAFTFPFLRSPNDIPVGCANLLGSKRHPVKFPPHITKFLKESAGKDVVYVSFGSYCEMNGVSWFLELMSILIKLDLRIIVKVGHNFNTEFPSSVLPLSWAPQKDLLKSGKLKLFVSHCGNNGRLETSFYNVPVLCIPQFADQPLNSEIIRLNGFGEKLMKEEIPSRAKEVVSKMIANYETYHEKMKIASDIVENEPGNVKENLIFYVEHVAKHKNVDYLVNKAIKQQSLVETYNLDIILPVCLILLAFVVTIVYILLKLCIYCIHVISCFGMEKQKFQ